MKNILLINQSCDVESGAIVRCVYATKFDFSEKASHGEIESISFKYGMENVLGEKFTISTIFYFYPTEENHINSYMQMLPIQKLEDGEEWW